MQFLVGKLSNFDLFFDLLTLTISPTDHYFDIKPTFQPFQFSALA